MSDYIYAAFAILPDGTDAEVHLSRETPRGVEVAIPYDYAIPAEYPADWIGKRITIRGGTRIANETRSGVIIEMQGKPKGQSDRPFWLLVDLSQ